MFFKVLQPSSRLLKDSNDFQKLLEHCRQFSSNFQTFLDHSRLFLEVFCDFQSLWHVAKAFLKILTSLRAFLMIYQKILPFYTGFYKILDNFLKGTYDQTIFQRVVTRDKYTKSI